MIQIKDSAECCGCTACASICTHNAIAMKPDALGFLYPVVDQSKCVNCGLCENVCSFNDHYDISLNLNEPLAYAARHKNEEELRYSRSGAVFVAFSDYILEHGGVVYGAGYTEHFRVIHKRAFTREESREFKGSKYVQSDMNSVFRDIKNDLKNGLAVLFSGTPCQTAGLISYIGKTLRNNLYIVDIICHAVPSPYIWRDYLKYVEFKNKKEVVSVEFRDKSIGWYQPHMERFTFKDNTIYKDYLLRYLFNAGLITRPSCSCCKYCNTVRPSDLTIGDFWGYEKVTPEMNTDNKGISLVICNTQKGVEFLSNCLFMLNAKKVDLKNALQPNLQNPSSIDSRYEQFAKDYEEKGFIYIAKKYGNVGYQYQLKQIIKKIKRKLSI